VNDVKNTKLLILLATIVRCIIACTTELGNDEVYYRLYADVLQWNYFDHPPMVGWLIRCTTANLLIDTTFTIRIGAIIAAAIATWLVFKCGALLQNTYTGFVAACIFTASIYCSIIAGTFILPDSPQIIFWILSIYLLLKITANKTINKKSKNSVLWFGIVTGIGMLCKIHTIFLWGGFGIYILFYQREWLSQWVLYAAIAITILFFTPVIYWNFKNNFITFFFHGNRVNVAAGGVNIESMLTFIGGQILYCNPVVFYIIGVAIFKNTYTIARAHSRILWLVSAPIIVLATCISLFKELLPHWTGPGFIGLILLAACYYAPLMQQAFQKKLLPLSVRIAHALIAIVIVIGLLGINFFPGTLGSKNVQKLGDGDFTLDMYGWKKFGHTFDSIYKSTHSNNIATNTGLVCDKWFPAAHIQMYVTNALPIHVIGYGVIEDIHQYHWLNTQKLLHTTDSMDLYYIVPSNYFSDVNTSDLLKNIKPTTIDTIFQKRSNVIARKFYVYYYKKNRFNFKAALL
jgi:hypothetical protein